MASSLETDAQWLTTALTTTPASGQAEADAGHQLLLHATSWAEWWEFAAMLGLGQQP